MRLKVGTVPTIKEAIIIKTNTARRPTAGGRPLDLDTWLSFDELCELLGQPRSTVARWRATKKAPAGVRLPNGNVRFRRSEIDAWLESLPSAA